jgi:sugar O-acyltransferase (sialic acid O-acetyltransferase NeuD family)
MKIPLLLIGGGGHALSLIDVIESTDDFEVAGIVEAVDGVSTELVGYQVIGFDDELELLLNQTPNCIIAVGQIKSASVRATLFDSALQAGANFPQIISPRTRIASSVQIGKGACVMHDCVLSHLVEIGDNTIVNNKALIEHETIIGKHCHISTGAIVNGGVQILDGCFVGSGAIIAEGILVTHNVVIGAGTVVIENITEAGTYVGNPARKIK